QTPPAHPSSEELARMVVHAVLDRKAEAVRVLDLSKVSDFTDLFVICSGTNERQVQAITDRVLKGLRDKGVRPLHVEGQQHGRWVLIDFGGDLVAHVFYDEARRTYDLERLWSDAPDVTDRFVPAEAS
ncbi:MAG: ribosome silencing factor, partial [Acidobacteriota bacterium]